MASTVAGSSRRTSCSLPEVRRERPTRLSGRPRRAVVRPWHHGSVAGSATRPVDPPPPLSPRRSRAILAIAGFDLRGDHQTLAPRAATGIALLVARARNLTSRARLPPGRHQRSGAMIPARVGAARNSSNAALRATLIRGGALGTPARCSTSKPSDAARLRHVRNHRQRTGRAGDCYRRPRPARQAPTLTAPRRAFLLALARLIEVHRADAAGSNVLGMGSNSETGPSPAGQREPSHAAQLRHPKACTTWRASYCVRSPHRTSAERCSDCFQGDGVATFSILTAFSIL